MLAECTFAVVLDCRGVYSHLCRDRNAFRLVRVSKIEGSWTPIWTIGAAKARVVDTRVDCYLQYFHVNARYFEIDADLRLDWKCSSRNEAPRRFDSLWASRNDLEVSKRRVSTCVFRLETVP